MNNLKRAMATTGSHRFCENCGAGLGPNIRFCEQCGRAVDQQAVPAVAPEQVAPVQRERRAEFGRSGMWTWVVLAAGAVLMAIAGVGWWMQHSKETASAKVAYASQPAPVSADTVDVVAPNALPQPPLEPVSPPVQPTEIPVAPPPASNPLSAHEVAAAKDLAEMVLWWGNQPWVKALKKSMPRGVTISMHAEPYNAEGWSDVEVREQHSTDSSFDPDVSPMVGLFRVSRAGRSVEWMEPVSGDYQPLEGFLKSRGLSVAKNTPGPPESDVTSAGYLGITAGNFETQPPEIPNRDAAVVVPDPTNTKNHVARIIGPDEMSFTLPISVPKGTNELTVSLRLLHPEGTKLIQFEDGKTPEGIRLRVRLLNEIGNSAIRDAVVRPTGQWREMEFNFHDLMNNAVQVSVEAIWMEGPVYVDDVRIVP